MKCYDCNYENDTHTDLSSPMNKPINGDISVCINCGALGEFQNCSIIPLSVETRAELIMDYPENWNYILAIQSEIREIKNGRKNLSASNVDGSMENTTTGPQC